MAAVWTIRNTNYVLSKDGKSNVIERIEAHVSDKDGEFTAGEMAAARLQTDDLSSFKAFSDVTEADCITWLKEVLGDQVTEIEKRLTDHIAARKNPTHASGLPWVS
tara:strand:- start:1225 stop:1542 length:318 start_codon:yes stop_codon:yes gene_type:complete